MHDIQQKPLDPTSSDHLSSYRLVVAASMSNGLFFVAQTIVFLAITPLTLYALGKEVYGLWTIMLAILGFSNLAQFGTDAAVAKYTAQYSTRNDLKDKFSTVVTFSHVFMLTTGVLISLVIWSFRYWIAQHLEFNANVAELLPNVFGLMAFGVIPGFLFSASRGVLLGLVHNNLANSLDLGSNILLWIGATIIGIMEGSILYLALWVVIINVIRFLFSGYFTIRVTAKYNLRFILDFRTIKELIHFSFLSWAATFGGTMFQSLDRILVGMLLGPSASGVYGIATSVGARSSGFASRIAQALLPFSSAEQVAGYRQRIVSALRHSSSLVGCGSLFLTGISVIWMDEILCLWISPGFSSDYSLSFRLIMVCYGIYSIVLPAQHIAQGMGWVAFPACIYLGSGLAMNLLIWALAPKFGIVGAIAANFVLISLIAINFYLTKKLGLSLSTVYKDLGLLVLLFLSMMVIPFLVISLPIKLLATIVLTSITALLALRQGRSKTMLRLMQGS
jgi:O-antigen/teichoic acid export membrane protein